MKSEVILLDAEKWKALAMAKLTDHFYAAVLWDGTPLKVVEDPLLMSRRG